MEKIQIRRGRCGRHACGQVRLARRVGLEPGLDWFEEHFLSGGRHEPGEASAALELREEDERRSRSFLAAKAAKPWATYILITLNVCMFAAVFQLALQYAQQGAGGQGMSSENWELAS